MLELPCYQAQPPVLIIGTISEALWWVGSISYLAYMVVKSNNRRNLIFIPLLSLIMGLDIATLVFAFVGNYSLSTHLAYTAVFMITCVVTIVGGRVIPFFTSRALNLPTIKGNIFLERTIAPSDDHNSHHFFQQLLY